MTEREKQRLDILNIAKDIGKLFGLLPLCNQDECETCGETNCLFVVARKLYELGWRKVEQGTSDDTINEYFEKTYAIYPRKVSKEQARKTYAHKLVGLDVEGARKKALTIYKALETQKDIWQKEYDGAGRKIEHIPYFSSWLNANVEDSPKRSKRR